MSTTRIRGALALFAALVAAPAFAQYSAPMHDTNDPDLTPFMFNSTTEIDAPFVNNFLFFSTPSSKRYFLQELSVTCTTSSTTDVMTQAYLLLNQRIAGVDTSITGPNMPLVKTGPGFGGGSVWIGTMALNAFSDPENVSGGGQSIFVDVFHSESQNTVQCTGYVSGHTLAQ